LQAINDEGGGVNVTFDYDHDTSQSLTDTIPAIAKRFKSRGQRWALVVDDNYGEGSAREHAALQPRFYGAKILLFPSYY
jgi:homoaconitase